MERAAQELFALTLGVRLAKLHASMWAGVDKGLDGAGRVADDDYGIGADVVDDVVADVGDVFLPTGPLPGFAPDAVDLAIVEFL